MGEGVIKSQYFPRSASQMPWNECSMDMAESEGFLSLSNVNAIL